jgi:hypothetical protein
VVEALQLLLDDLCGGFRQGLGVRARIDGGDRNLGRGERRELGDREAEGDDRAEQHHQDGEHPGKNRAVDEEA